MRVIHVFDVIRPFQKIKIVVLFRFDIHKRDDHQILTYAYYISYLLP